MSRLSTLLLLSLFLPMPVVAEDTGTPVFTIDNKWEFEFFDEFDDAQDRCILKYIGDRVIFMAYKNRYDPILLNVSNYTGSVNGIMGSISPIGLTTDTGKTLLVEENFVVQNTEEDEKTFKVIMTDGTVSRIGVNGQNNRVVDSWIMTDAQESYNKWEACIAALEASN